MKQACPNQMGAFCARRHATTCGAVLAFPGTMAHQPRASPARSPAQALARQPRRKRTAAQPAPGQLAPPPAACSRRRTTDKS